MEREERRSRDRKSENGKVRTEKGEQEKKNGKRRAEKEKGKRKR